MKDFREQRDEEEREEIANRARREGRDIEIALVMHAAGRAFAKATKKDGTAPVIPPDAPIDRSPS